MSREIVTEKLIKMNLSSIVEVAIQHISLLQEVVEYDFESTMTREFGNQILTITIKDK